MANPSKKKGTECESAVVKVFRDAGFRAKRLTLHGSKDVGDIDIGLDSVVIEVKGGKAAENASDGQIEKWLDETEAERRNAKAKIGILVVKRKGIGATNAGKWWAILDDSDYHWLIGAAPGGFASPVRIHLDTLVGHLRRLT